MLTGNGATRAKAEDTNVLASPLNDAPDMIEQFFSTFFNLRTLLQQSDCGWTSGKFAMISVGMAVAGMVLPLVCRVPVALAPFGCLLGVMPLLYVVFKRKSRLAKFAKQLPEALELISRALRAGHSLASGFRLVGDELGAPISTEFERCYEAQNLGQPLEEAIEEMTQRVPNLDLRFFATAVILQRQTGGDLAEILDKIGHLVRERYIIWGQIQSLTGEGRLSGIVLLALPPVLAIVMWRLNPGYLMTLFKDPMGHQMLAFAVVMQIVGALVIRHIVNIKV
jgi:tight adherence protein B